MRNAKHASVHAQSHGVVAPMLAAFLGAASLSAATLAAGGGLFLAFLVYSLGGSALLLAVALLAARLPARALPRARRARPVPALEGLRHG